MIPLSHTVSRQHERYQHNTTQYLFQTLTHEIGHIFGLRHCQWLQCVMQGSNHLEEADRRPLDLCPICLRKLQAALGFSIMERYQVQQCCSGRDLELSMVPCIPFVFCPILNVGLRPYAHIYPCAAGAATV